jgi:signal transduction histidine kinase
LSKGSIEKGEHRVNIEKTAPLEKLRWFESLLGLDDPSFNGLDPYRAAFTAAKDNFAHDFSERLRKIPETHIYLDHEKRKGYLRDAWAGWFLLLFGEGLTDRFLSYQWKSGLRHVEVGIDHRFVILGYSYLRQFCHRIVASVVPQEGRESVLDIVDRMVDLCLLVETQAFIEATAQCDVEVVRGMSHQVRNPITVIGGNLARLKKKAPSGDPVHEIYDILIEESERLEEMVDDAETYSDLFRKETVFSRLSLHDVISDTLERARKRSSDINVDTVLDLDPDASEVHADKNDMEVMFLHLFENGLEMLDRRQPRIGIVSRRGKGRPLFVEVEISIAGRSPGTDEIENLFAPFNSPNPYATGFGLSIARLAARRNLGEVFLEPVPGEGVKIVVKIPAAMEP